MSHGKQQKILDDLMIIECFPNAELEYSIFDDVRQIIFREMKNICFDDKEKCPLKMIRL